MSQNDAPDFKSGQKNCCNCDNGQFGGGSDDFRCLKYNFLFDYGMPHASHLIFLTSLLSRWRRNRSMFNRQMNL